MPFSSVGDLTSLRPLKLRTNRGEAPGEDLQRAAEGRVGVGHRLDQRRGELKETECETEQRYAAEINK